MSRDKWDQIAVIERFAEEKPDGVQVYDFGDSTVSMPIPDLKSGSYLMSSVCALFVKGTGDLKLGNSLSRRDEVMEFPGGWKFITIEFTMTTQPEELREMLVKAKNKLLGR